MKPKRAIPKKKKDNFWKKNVLKQTMILNSYSWYHDSKIWTSPSLFLSNMTLMYWESVNADRQVLGGWRYKQAKCCCIQEGTRIHTCCWVVASYLISWSLVNDQSITAWFEVTLYHNYHFQSAYSHKHCSERSKRCLIWAGAKNPWQNSKAWYSDTCGGLECKGWGSTRWWRRSDRPPPMTWGAVRKWATLRRNMRKQPYGHRKLPHGHRNHSVSP